MPTFNSYTVQNILQTPILIVKAPLLQPYKTSCKYLNNLVQRSHKARVKFLRTLIASLQ